MIPFRQARQHLFRQAKRLALGGANVIRKRRTGTSFSDQDHDLFAAAPGSAHGSEVKPAWTSSTFGDSIPPSLAVHEEERTIPLLDCEVLPEARILSVYGHTYGLNLKELHGSSSSADMRQAAMLSSILPETAPGKGMQRGFSIALIQERLWWDNYFHWTLDYLTQIIWAERHLKSLGAIDLTDLSLFYITKPSTRTYQRESLELLEWTGLQCQEVRSTRRLLNLKLNNLLVIQDRYAIQQMDPSCHNNQLHPSIINSLSDLITSSPLIQARETRQRIYISRSKGSSRRVVNEDQVIEALELHGIQTITLEDLNVAEQVSLFRAAELVIAPHGAGLTNLIYAERPAVLELFCSGHRIGAEYFQITAIRGGRYFFHVLEPANSANDMIVPIDLLEHYLEVLLSA